MNLDKKLKAFTLVELLVVIAIIWILAFWISQIDFNSLSNKQKIERYTNTIKSNIENVRNKALLGKWIKVWTDLVVPKKWVMDFAKTWSWIIITKALKSDLSILENTDFPMKTWYKIISIKCWKYWENETNYNVTYKTWTINFIWWNISLTGEDCSNTNILLLTIKKVNKTIKIKINTLNWLVETK